MPSALKSMWKIRVIARVISRESQTVVLRFTPVTKEVASAGPVEFFLTRKRGAPQPIQVALARGTRLTLELDRVDPAQDSISVTLRGDSILGKPVGEEDRMTILVD